MPPEVAFALLSLAFLGVSDFLYRWGQRAEVLHGGPFMLVQNLAYLPAAFAMTYARGELYWVPELSLGLVNGLLAFIGFLFVLMALRRGEALVLAPIVRLNFAVTGLLTVLLLGEQIDATKAIALALAAAAILAGGSGLRSVGRDRRPFWLALSAMGIFGLMGLFYKFAINHGAPPAGMVLFQSIGVFFVAVPFAIQQRKPVPRRGTALWVPVTCGVLTSASYVALAVAMRHGDAVVVAPIAQLSFVLTGVLAVLFLRERLTPRKTAAVGCAIASVLLFAST